MRTTGGTVRRTLGVLVVLGLALAACGDDGDSTTDEGDGCPLTAEELTSALGETFEATEAPDSTCAFVEEGGSIDQPTDLRVVVEPTPEGVTIPRGPDVTPTETSSTPESADVIYEATIAVVVDGSPYFVFLRGASSEDQRDESADAIAALLP